MNSKKNHDDLNLDDLGALLGEAGCLPPVEISIDDLPECPVCSGQMKKIVYGFPTRGPLPEEDWVPGGCVVMMGNPKFRCVGCGTDF
jgi:hypothetical protein